MGLVFMLTLYLGSMWVAQVFGSSWAKGVCCCLLPYSLSHDGGREIMFREECVRGKLSLPLNAYVFQLWAYVWNM